MEEDDPPLPIVLFRERMKERGRGRASSSHLSIKQSVLSHSSPSLSLLSLFSSTKKKEDDPPLPRVLVRERMKERGRGGASSSHLSILSLCFRRYKQVEGGE